MPRGAPNQQAQPDEAQTTQSQGSTPLSGHRNYAEYKAEHEKLHPGVAALSESVWSGGSSGGSSGAPANTGERKDSEFRVTGTMTEIGTTAAGITDQVGRVQPKTDGAAVLYDDATGKLYETTDWHAVNRNWNYLVGSDGKRQRVAGYVAAPSEEDGEFALRGSAKPGQQMLVVGYNESLPAPGTEEYKKFLSDKFYAVAGAQAIQNRLTVDEDGHVSGAHTDFGQMGSVSASDYIKLGRPGRVGNLDLSEYAEMSDDEILAKGILIGQDTKNRSHGVEKALNSVGRLFGDDNFGHELMRTLTDIAAVPVVGSILSVAIDPINAYETARDSGYSAGAAGRESGKAGLAAVNDAYIDAAAAALTVVAVAAAPFTGGASLAFGAAAGAALGAAGAAARSGMRSTIYGGYDENAFLNSVAEGAVTGAITGTMQGIGRAATTPGASPAWQTAGRVVDSGWTQAAVNTVSGYGIAYSRGGESRDHADEAAVRSLVGGSVSALAGDTQVGQSLGWGGTRYTENFSNYFVNAALRDNRSILTRVGSAFRGQVGSQGGLIGMTFGAGSNASQWERSWNSATAPAAGENRVPYTDFLPEGSQVGGRFPAWHSETAQLSLNPQLQQMIVK
jgi:hypothetical protein